MPAPTASTRPASRRASRSRPSVKAVAPKPVNFLNSGAFGFTVADLAAMGVRRISVGGTLARVAMHAFIKSARDDRRAGQVRQLRRRDAERRAQRVLPRRPEEAAIVTDHKHPQTGQPVGAPVDTTPAPLARPGDAARPLRPCRATGAARMPIRCGTQVKDADTIWTYIASSGPFADKAAFARLARQARRRRGSVRLRDYRPRRAAPSALRP